MTTIFLLGGAVLLAVCLFIGFMNYMNKTRVNKSSPAHESKAQRGITAKEKEKLKQVISGGVIKDIKTKYPPRPKRDGEKFCYEETKPGKAYDRRADRAKIINSINRMRNVRAQA